jgi:hypothetical protein
MRELLVRGKNTIHPGGRSVEKPREVTLTFLIYDKIYFISTHWFICSTNIKCSLMYGFVTRKFPFLFMFLSLSEHLACLNFSAPFDLL